jgi:flagellar protein FliO/FliZ
MDALDSTVPLGTVEAPGGLSTFIETIIVLLLFILGIYGVFRFVQKKRGNTGAGDETIRILAGVSVGGSRLVQLVEVGSRVFLIGVGDGSVNLIAEIQDQADLERFRLQASAAEGGREGFLEKLFTLLGRGRTAAGRRTTEMKVDFLRRQKDRLTRLDK